MAVFNYSQVIRRSILLITLAVFVQFAFNNYVCANDLLPGVGAVGDSLTNEYSQRAWYYGDSSALNWVDLLAQLRDNDSNLTQLTFGNYQTNPDIWGSPRNGGYENNWAKGGADTATLLSEGQHTGIASQARAGQVQYVALFIGSNDFNPYAHDAYSAIYSQTEPFIGTGARQYADANEYVDSIIERYITALDVVSKEGVRIVMATIADFGVTPHVVNNFPNAEKRQRVTNVMKTVNNRLKALATTRSLPIVDIFEMANLYLGSNPLMVGSIPITRAAPLIANSQYLILPDLIHPGTVWQGLLANAFIEACNHTYGTNFAPLSDQEILGAAGIEYAAGDETFFDITPYLIVPTLTKYSGGTGEPNDPYQIATAEDLMLLGDSPEDYDKHFILTADIDLDPNLPGRKVFDRAVIAPDINDLEHAFQGIPFTGIFDGNDHIILHLTITSESESGLIAVSELGFLGLVASQAEIRNLSVVAIDISGPISTGALVKSEHIGALAGRNSGSITGCFSSGKVSGDRCVGGLVGRNTGSITTSYSISEVTGNQYVGGLAGQNMFGSILACYSNGVVTGNRSVGGLVGSAQRQSGVRMSYSTSAVKGTEYVGGFVGYNSGHEGSSEDSSIKMSYSTGKVRGDKYVGGLVGNNGGSITSAFWNIETSGQTTSTGGVGLTTVEMRDVSTYIDAGWDFVGEIINGTCDCWQALPGEYPSLYYFAGKEPVMPEGLGTLEEPYLIQDARDIGTVWFKPLAHYRLDASIDLSGITWIMAPIPWFGGTLDGNNQVISNLNIEGGSCIGMFGTLSTGSEVFNLGLESVDVRGNGINIGSLAGFSIGDVNKSYSTGSVEGRALVGGLVGQSWGNINGSFSICTVQGIYDVGGLIGFNNQSNSICNCYSSGTVIGNTCVGGLLGSSWGSSAIVTQCWSTAKVTGYKVNTGGLAGYNHSTISRCYSNGVVDGNDIVGGLVGYNEYSYGYGVSSFGIITDSYSNSVVYGNSTVGGLVGRNEGDITMSYSTGAVAGDDSIGGLVGINWSGWGGSGGIFDSFWDIQTSGLENMCGRSAFVVCEDSYGKTIAQMQTATTFLEAGWDFVDETDNGIEDIWWIDEGNDYPRLWWELIPEN